MKEVGIVNRVVSKNIVEIRAATKEECDQCPLVATCPSHLSDKKGTILAWDEAGAGIGDLVEYEYEEKDILKGIFTVYMVPFFYFLAGLFVGFLLEKVFNVHLGHLENLLTVLTTLGFLAAGILSVKEKDKNFRIPSKVVGILYKNPAFVEVNLSDKSESRFPERRK